MRIAIIEDDDMMLADLMEMLTYEGFDPIGARTAHDGLDVIRTRHPDVILCDVVLPDLNGFAVLDALRADPITAAIPLIFLSGRTERRHAELGIQNGAFGYIMKPFNVVALLDTIRSAVESRV